jgi:glycosyltransferase involved in cell wall biosynthesis
VQEIIQHFDHQAPADLLIAGTGAYEPQLRSLAAAFPRVHFLGKLSAEELRFYYRNAIALVVPSLCYETFGIILLEAFRDKTPVIARALGPFTEIVQQSGGGLLFRTADELKEALRKLASDQALRDHLGACGYQKFQELWTERVVVQQYFHLINRIARRRGLAHIVNLLSEAAFGQAVR